MNFPGFFKRVAIAAAALVIGTVSSHAQEIAQISNPLTVKPGEELRITLYNPDSEPLVLKVFAYNAIENSYDEGPNIVLPPGRLRFFDFKLTKEFVGLAGVIEVVPTNGGVEASRAPAQSDSPKPEQILAVTHTFRSMSSVQHRGPNGQSQTLGLNRPATGGGGIIRQTRIPASAVKVSRSAWEASPE